MTKQDDFLNAIYSKKTDIFMTLINNPEIDPAYNNNLALCLASEIDNIEVVRMLLKDKRVDPSDDDDFSIIASSNLGHTSIVKMLLNDKRVNPSAKSNQAIQDSSKFGYTVIVKLLLKDKRVNPAANNNSAIISAYKNKDIRTVNALWNSNKVKESLKKDDFTIFNKLIKYDIKNKIGKF
jgi:hypothetical protein